MNNLNKHIEELFNEKANSHKADESFSKLDFEAIRGKLPTLPNVASTHKNKPSNFFKHSTLLTIAGVVSVIGVIFFFNKGKKNEIVKTNTAIENNAAITKNNTGDSSESKNRLDSATKKPEVTKINSENIAKIIKDTNLILSNKVTNNSLNITPLKNDTENKIAVQRFFNDLASESQFYNINSSKDTIVICKNGTTLNIKANSFTTLNKTEVNGIVEVEIKEAYNFTDVIANGLHTLSNSNLLKSAGMVYINAKKNEQLLDINIKQTIEITMATSAKKEKMQLFNLDKNSSDNLLVSNSNWIAKEQTQNDKNTFSIRNFGWINSAQFSNNDNEKTTIKIAIQNKADSANTKAMLVFSKTKSVINLNFRKGFFTQKNIPTSEDAYFICFKIENGKMLYIIQKIVTQNNIIQAQEYKEIPTAEVKAMLNAIGNLQ